MHPPRRLALPRRRHGTSGQDRCSAHGQALSENRTRHNGIVTKQAGAGAAGWRSPTRPRLPSSPTPPPPPGWTRPDASSPWRGSWERRGLNAIYYTVTAVVVRALAADRDAEQPEERTEGLYSADQVTTVIITIAISLAIRVAYSGGKNQRHQHGTTATRCSRDTNDNARTRERGRPAGRRTPPRPTEPQHPREGERQGMTAQSTTKTTMATLRMEIRSIRCRERR